MLGRLDTVVEQLRAVMDLRERSGWDLRVGLSTVVGRANVAELPALGRLAAELGVDWLKVEETFPATPFAREDLLVPSDPRITQALAGLREALAGSAVVLVDHLDPPTRGAAAEAFRAADDFANRATFAPERMAWELACVDPDGVVRAVDYFHDPLGSLIDTPLLDLWNNEAARALRAACLRG